MTIWNRGKLVEAEGGYATRYYDSEGEMEKEIGEEYKEYVESFRKVYEENPSYYASPEAFRKHMPLTKKNWRWWYNKQLKYCLKEPEERVAMGENNPLPPTELVLSIPLRLRPIMDGAGKISIAWSKTEEWIVDVEEVQKYLCFLNETIDEGHKE